MRIGLDIDGVLADLVGHWQAHFRHAFGEPTWTHDEGWGLADGNLFPDDHSVFEYLDIVPGFWESMPTVPGAEGAVWRLLRDGHTLRLITNRGTPAARAGTGAWLRSWWPARKDLPSPEFVPGYKGIVDCQLYVEDRPVRIVELAEGHDRAGEHANVQYPPKQCVVVFDQPYNRDLPDDDLPNLVRAFSWAEVLKIVRRVSAGQPAKPVKMKAKPKPKPKGTPDA